MTMTLTEAIKAVAPHVSKDRSLRALMNVRVVNGTVSATDRFTLAVVTLPADVLDPRVDTVLTPDDVKAGVASITIPGDGVGDAVLTFTSGASKQALAGDAHGDYPDLLTLSEKLRENVEKATTGATSLGVNLDYLARFHGKFFPKMYGSSKNVVTPRFHFADENTKPVRVTFAAHEEYVGFIVPLREVTA